MRPETKHTKKSSKKIAKKTVKKTPNATIAGITYKDVADANKYGGDSTPIDYDSANAPAENTLIYSGMANADVVINEFDKNSGKSMHIPVTDGIIDTINSETATINKKMFINEDGRIYFHDNDGIIEFPKDCDWDDIPRYVLDAFKTWTSKSSMESTIMVGETFTISYTTPDSKSYACINIGQKLRNNGEELIVQSTQAHGGTYNVNATFDRKGLMQHKNARELYNHIVAKMIK